MDQLNYLIKNLKIINKPSHNIIGKIILLSQKKYNQKNNLNKNNYNKIIKTTSNNLSINKK